MANYRLRDSGYLEGGRTLDEGGKIECSNYLSSE
jgi:hypothetical protein